MKPVAEGRARVSFQNAAPKFVHRSDHAPLALALVFPKGGNGERPWDGASLGLSIEGRQAGVTMGVCSDCAAL
jgi:hypothetical protein